MSRNTHSRMYISFIKPLLDFLFSAIFLCVASPLLIIVIILLLITNDRKVFFLQPRPGKNGKIFRIIKFKTMNDRTDAEGKLLDDQYRLTPIGKFIRKTSIDEIPQLLNVILFDMSLIGPRPLLVEYLHLYNDIQMRRHKVKPGITGWAQINGRNAITWEQKFDYDVWYVDNISFMLDCRIFLKTIVKIFRREGINANASTTMTKFKG